MLKFALTIVGCATLTGCGTSAPNSDVGLVHTGLSGRPAVADVSGVAIQETGPSLSANAVRVSGYSCKNKMWDPAPSEQNAIALMKKEAAAKGFNTVHSVKVLNDPAAVAKNCWSGLIATGIAFRSNTEVNPPE